MPGAFWDQLLPPRRASPHPSGNQDERRAAKHATPRGQAKVLEFLTLIRSPITLGSREMNLVLGLELNMLTFLGQIPEAEGFIFKDKQFAVFSISHQK